jgi:Outer membrane protein beta-barrel domain
MSCFRSVLTASFLVACSALTSPLYAQGENHFFTFNVGGGFTTQTNRTADHLDGGGNLQLGAGINLGRVFSLGCTFMFNGMGLTRSTLDAVNEPDGHAHVFTLTVEPKLRVPIWRGQAYVLGGGGWMRRTVTFTQPVLATTFVFDPWWGYYGPALVPASQNVGSVTQDAGVWDVGAGFDIPLPKSTSWKLYVEARYFEGLTDQTHTEIVPITVGLRW